MEFFYDCGICGHFHNVNWNGDCREDNARFTEDQLDREFPEWIEVDQPEGSA